MITFEKVLAKVKATYPHKGHEEQLDIAHDWCREIAAEEPPYDTDCIQDHMPAEYFTERER